MSMSPPTRSRSPSSPARRSIRSPGSSCTSSPRIRAICRPPAKASASPTGISRSRGRARISTMPAWPGSRSPPTPLSVCAWASSAPAKSPFGWPRFPGPRNGNPSRRSPSRRAGRRPRREAAGGDQGVRIDPGTPVGRGSSASRLGGLGPMSAGVPCGSHVSASQGFRIALDCP